jgi:membrane protein DedA with SNARE-associated domain
VHVQEWLETVPAVSIYLLVGVVIGLESLGIPLPGEIVLVSSALLASQHGDIDPYILGACATAGAIIGDSIGYAIGRKGGRPLLAWLGGKVPKHFGEAQIAMAERSFEKWGMWAVFFGRFVALLRIFAGPLAGVLRMPYWKFLIANVFGGILWAGGSSSRWRSVSRRCWCSRAGRRRRRRSSRRPWRPNRSPSPSPTDPPPAADARARAVRRPGVVRRPAGGGPGEQALVPARRAPGPGPQSLCASRCWAARSR